MVLRLIIFVCFAGGTLQAGEPVFADSAAEDGGQRHADVLLSNEVLLPGARIEVRNELEFSILVAAKKKRTTVPYKEIVRIRQIVVEEGLEKQWRWKEGGANEKFYTGKAYPWRKLQVEITKADGSVVKGKLSSGVPVTITWKETVDDKQTGEKKEAEKKRKVLITPRQKGSLGDALESLVFVKDMTFKKTGNDKNAAGVKPDPGDVNKTDTSVQNADCQ